LQYKTRYSQEINSERSAVIKDVSAVLGTFIVIALPFDAANILLGICSRY